jgi:plastocyanin
MIPNAAAALAAVLLLAACGGGEAPAPAGDAATPAPAAAAAAATGDTIVVEMITDGDGNVFKPALVEAEPGDVIRYTLVSGVHNVHFLADSNPGVPNLPATSDMLQLPGQTHDVTVSMAPGRYYFQCDPHALLGMVGHVVVKAEDD